MPTQPSRKERPLGVVIVALFLVADAIVAFGDVALDFEFTNLLDVLYEANEWMPAVVVAIGIARLLAAAGLWLGLRVAWVLAMLIVGIGLIFNFYVYWVGEPHYVRLAIDIVIAFYLNQRAVRDYYEGPPDERAGWEGRG